MTNEALEKACNILVDLNQCTNVHSDEYCCCPFRDEREKGDECISTHEKWKEYLLKEEDQ